MTPKQRLDSLLETVSVPTNTTVTIATLRSALSQEEYAAVRLTLEAATVPVDDTPQAKIAAADIADALAAMQVVGISLSTPDRQAAIDLLAERGRWPNELRNKVKALGITALPLWKAQGYQTEPTLALTTLEVMRDKLKAKTTAIVGWLDAYDVSEKTPDQVTEYVEMLLASEDGNPP